jgi:hypothetical protein
VRRSQTGEEEPQTIRLQQGQPLLPAIIKLLALHNNKHNVVGSQVIIILLPIAGEMFISEHLLQQQIQIIQIQTITTHNGNSANKDNGDQCRTLPKRKILINSNKCVIEEKHVPKISNLPEALLLQHQHHRVEVSVEDPEAVAQHQAVVVVPEVAEAEHQVVVVALEAVVVEEDN